MKLFMWEVLVPYIYVYQISNNCIDDIQSAQPTL